MVGLSVCNDGAALDPLLIPCRSTRSLADAEEDEDGKEETAELRGLFFRPIPVPLSSRPAAPEFHQFLPAPSPEPLPRSHPPDASDRGSLAPDGGGGGGGGLHDVVVKLPNEKTAGREAEGRGADASPSDSRKRTRTEFAGMVAWLRGTAIDPRDRTRVAAEEEWLETQVLRARKTLFWTLDDATKKSEFPPPPEKKLKTGKLSSEGSQKKNGGKLGSIKMINKPKRRSERIAQNANQNHLRMRRQRIGLGSNFQADVPDWTCPPSETDVSNYKMDLNTLKWLGSQIWPAEEDDRKTSEAVFRKEKPNYCACSFPGSMFCNSSHVGEARLSLKDDLGQAFFDWGFDEMGEEVSKSWTHEEQIRFDALKRLENVSGYNSFWETASMYFSSKSRRDLISYYFNVYLLRRTSYQSRMTPENINTDEDDDDDGKNENTKKMKRLVVKKRAKLMRNHAPDFQSVNGVKSFT